MDMIQVLLLILIIGTKEEVVTVFTRTQDFGGSLCSGDTEYPIPSGSRIQMEYSLILHRIDIERPSGTYRFMASFYQASGSSPQTASVVISGTQHAMTVDGGSGTASHWFFTAAKTSGCTQYYFYFVDSAGTSWYYPESGESRDSKRGSGFKEFQASFLAPIFKPNSSNLD